MTGSEAGGDRQPRRAEVVMLGARAIAFALPRGICDLPAGSAGSVIEPVRRKPLPLETLCEPSNIRLTAAVQLGLGGIVMVIRYADPFEALFAFQRALESWLASDWMGSTTAGSGSYPPINVFQQGDDLVAISRDTGCRQGRVEYRGEEQHYSDRRTEEDRVP